MADVTHRALALLAVLQTGRTFTGAELADRLAVSPRTLRRDVDRLRALGYPVQTQPGPGGHYRLVPGTALPPLLLDDDEAVAALVALAALAATGSATEGSLDDAAARAYGKVDQYLPRRLRAHATAVQASLETGHSPGPSTSAQTITALAAAIQHTRVVSFGYRDAIRRVEPHRQIHLRLRWYLLAFDLDRHDWRVFRIDRVSDVRESPQTFTARALPAGSGLAYLRQGLDRHRRRVVLTIAAPVATVADAFGHHDVELTPDGAGRTHAVVMADTWQWLLPGLAFLDAEVTVHEPADFRAMLHTFGSRLAKA